MIDQRQGVIDGIGPMGSDILRALDHHDLDAEFSCGKEFALRGAAAAVLADDDVDTVLSQQCFLGLDRKRSAGQKVFDIRNVQRRVDGIDAADKIVVLRGGAEGIRLLPTNRQEDPSRCRAEGIDRVADRGHGGPAVAGFRPPTRPLEPQQRHAGFRTRRDGILRHAGGERVGCVDQQVDALVAKIGHEAIDATETAGAGGCGKRGGVFRAAGERQGQRQVAAAAKPFSELAGFGRSGQNEDALLVQA